MTDLTGWPPKILSWLEMHDELPVVPAHMDLDCEPIVGRGIRVDGMSGKQRDALGAIVYRLGPVIKTWDWNKPLGPNTRYYAIIVLR